MTVSLVASVLTGARTGRSPRWWLLLAGPLAGAALGVVARVWMRLISKDPEFSWGGTVLIVVAFALTGFGHSVARAVRAAGRRRLGTVARIAGAVLTLPLFIGAGGLMLPTVVGGSLASWRHDWPRWARLIIAAVAAAPPAIVVGGTLRDHTSLRAIGGLVLFAGTYATVIGSLRPVVAPVEDAPRMRRAARIAVTAGVVLLMLAVASFTVGVATADL